MRQQQCPRWERQNIFGRISWRAAQCAGGFMAIITLLLVLQVLLLAPLAGALDNSLGKTPPCVINAALAEPDR